MKTKTALLPVLLTVVAALAVTGCNTMAGAGRDIESAGEAVQDAAN